MTRRFLFPTLLLLLSFPGVVRASDGILLLAHNGGPEWNTQITDLTARVDARKPAEVVFGSPAQSTMAPAVDRLVKRGVTQVIVVPFLMSSPVAPDVLSGYRIPVLLSPVDGIEAVLSRIITSRAAEVSNAPEGTLLLLGYGADDGGVSWAVDLGPVAKTLNGTGEFASVLTVTRPDRASESEQKRLRLLLDRQLSLGRSVVVVPVAASAGGLSPAMAQQLQGIAYKVAKRGAISDEQLVEWVLRQAGAGAPR